MTDVFDVLAAAGSDIVRDGVAVTAISAVDVALWDLAHCALDPRGGVLTPDPAGLQLKAAGAEHYRKA